MLLTLRRNELATEFWSRKFFLLDEKHAETTAREMYRRTTSRRASARDDHVEAVS